MPSTVGLSQTSRVPPAGDLLVTPTMQAPPNISGIANYIQVAASQTAFVLGNPGAQGDYLDHVIIEPAVAAAGAVTLLDGTTSLVLFAGGGTTALSDLKPFTVPVAARSLTGPWKITTGASVAVMAVGHFTGAL